MEFELLSEKLNAKQRIELKKGTTTSDTRKIIAKILLDNMEQIQTYKVNRPDEKIYGLYIKQNEGYILVRQEAAKKFEKDAIPV